jgi:hypothetical protein
MALTLRPTRLSRDPNAKDWSIHEEGEEIGRLYEDPTATGPEIASFWSIIIMGPARNRCAPRAAGSAFRCPFPPTNAIARRRPARTQAAAETAQLRSGWPLAPAGK